MAFRIRHPTLHSRECPLSAHPANKCPPAPAHPSPSAPFTGPDEDASARAAGHHDAGEGRSPRPQCDRARRRQRPEVVTSLATRQWTRSSTQDELQHATARYMSQQRKTVCCSAH
eukprot:6207979-Pleurochrysis_carterae.AAC.3